VLFSNTPVALRTCLLDLIVFNLASPDLPIQKRISFYKSLVADLSREGMTVEKAFNHLCQGLPNARRDFCLAISVSTPNVWEIHHYLFL
jgi:hypothetical protein